MVRGWIHLPIRFISLLVSSSELIRSDRESKLLEVHISLNNTVKKGFASFPPSFFAPSSALVFYSCQTLINIYLPQMLFEKDSL